MKFFLFLFLISCASKYRALNPTQVKDSLYVFSSAERLAELTILASKAKDLHVRVKNTSDQPLTLDLNLASQKIKSEKKTSYPQSYWYEGCGSREESCEEPRVILESKEEIEVHWDFDHYGLGRFNLPLKKNEGIVDVFNINFQKI